MNAGRDYFGANDKSDASVAAASPAGEYYKPEEPSSDEAQSNSACCTSRNSST